MTYNGDLKAPQLHEFLVQYSSAQPEALQDSPGEDVDGKVWCEGMKAHDGLQHNPGQSLQSHY